MKIKHSLLIILALTTIFACEDSTSDEFNDVNPDAVARYIETLSIVSAQDASENTTLTVNYDDENRVISITDGFDSSIFVYDNDELTSVNGLGENLSIEELYQSPFNAFEVGRVEEYDNNGNPKLITFFEIDFDFNTGMDVELEYTAEIEYDANPNPYFYTLDAAGVIDVMDNVQLNLSMNPSNDDVVQARLLFPLNNISGITYRDENGVIVTEIDANYVYNSDGYPTSATITGNSYDYFDGQLIEQITSVFTATFTYRD